MIGLLVQWHTHYEDIELFKQAGSQGLSEALDLEKTLFEATSRTRLGILGNKAKYEKNRGNHLTLLKAHTPLPIRLHRPHRKRTDCEETLFAHQSGYSAKNSPFLRFFPCLTAVISSISHDSVKVNS